MLLLNPMLPAFKYEYRQHRPTDGSGLDGVRREGGGGGEEGERGGGRKIEGEKEREMIGGKERRRMGQGEGRKERKVGREWEGGGIESEGGRLAGRKN